MSEDIYADFYDFAVTDISFVTLREPNPQWHTPTRAFVNPWSHILVYAMSGAADYEVGGQRYAIRQGDMLFFPKGMPHTGKSVPEDPWSFINVGFAGHPAVPRQAGRQWRLGGADSGGR